MGGIDAVYEPREEADAGLCDAEHDEQISSHLESIFKEPHLRGSLCRAVHTILKKALCATGKCAVLRNKVFLL